MKKVVIYYFSGTGNSKKVCEFTKDKFEQNDYEVKLIDISKLDSINFEESISLFGFVFPVYAFGIPRIVKKFLKRLPKVVEKQAFILTNFGCTGLKELQKGTEGGAIYQANSILKRKGFTIVGTQAVGMPNNFIISSSSANDEVNTIITKDAKDDVLKFVEKILKEEVYFKKKSFITRVFSRLISLLFIMNAWYSGKFFYSDKKCNECGICSQICPTYNIKMSDGKPSWGLNCEFCLRCINMCPQNSIQFIIGTKNKRRYKSPYNSVNEFIKK